MGAPSVTTRSLLGSVVIWGNTEVEAEEVVAGRLRGMVAGMIREVEGPARAVLSGAVGTRIVTPSLGRVNQRVRGGIVQCSIWYPKEW